MASPAVGISELCDKEDRVALSVVAKCLTESFCLYSSLMSILQVHELPGKAMLNSEQMSCFGTEPLEHNSIILKSIPTMPREAGCC